MGQKTNPISLRLDSTNRHFDSCWYSNYFYNTLVTKDLGLQHYLNTFLKLLKLPWGRYSITHFQKTTQVSNFFWYCKSTRTWRSRILGLNKRRRKHLKKNRFFFKTNTKFHKNFKQNQKFKTHSLKKNKIWSKSKALCFYRTLNQVAIYKIQKKVKAFQNFRLWSLLSKTHNSTRHKNLNTAIRNTLIFSKINQHPFLFHSEPSTISSKKAFSLLPVTSLLNKTSSVFNFYKKPVVLKSKKMSSQTTLKKFNSFSTVKAKKQRNTQIQFLLEKPTIHSSLAFLQQLVIYRAYRSHQNLKCYLNSTFPKIQLGLKTRFLRKQPTQVKKKFVSSFSKNKIGHFLKNTVFKKRTVEKNAVFKKKNFSTSSLENQPRKGFSKIFLSQKQRWLEKHRFCKSDQHNQLTVFKPLHTKYNTYIESFLSSVYKTQLTLLPFKVKNDWQSANFLADELVYFLEKRIPFRRLKGKILHHLATNQEIRGIRVTCSGRVGGKSKKAQRSKTECFKSGQTSLQVLSSKIDFSLKTAFTRFGSLGVKVWICYN